MRTVVLIVFIALSITGCSHPQATARSERHYAMTGEVTAVNPKAQTATINAAAIPNYMEAMTMDYPIKSKAELETLHPGDKIKATVNVSDSGDYNLSDIQKQSSGR